MKPFNLTAALNGSPVQTRDGRDVIIVYNPDVPFHARVLGWVFRDGHFVSSGTWTGRGHVRTDEAVCSGDLFMKSHQKREGWLNIYSSVGEISKYDAGHIYDTEEKARDACVNNNYVATVKIEWEE